MNFIYFIPFVTKFAKAFAKPSAHRHDSFRKVLSKELSAVPPESKRSSSDGRTGVSNTRAGLAGRITIYKDKTCVYRKMKTPAARNTCPL